jgi:hypothetical protein
LFGEPKRPRVAQVEETGGGGREAAAINGARCVVRVRNCD